MLKEFESANIAKITGSKANAANNIIMDSIRIAQTDIAENGVLTSRINFIAVAPIKCHFFANGIKKRDDVDMIGVCFGNDSGTDQGVLIIAPFFQDNAISEVEEIITKEYGKPVRKIGLDTVWWYAPWYSWKILQKFIILRPQYGTLAYFNVMSIILLQKSREEQLEKQRKEGL